MNPVHDLVGICRQLEAMSLVDKPIQLTGKQAVDIEKVERVLQEALANPVGETAADRIACRDAVQKLAAQLKVFSPQVNEFQTAILDRRYYAAWKIAANPATFRDIQAAAAYLKLTLGPWYDEFIRIKLLLEDLLKIEQGDAEREFLWKVAQLRNDHSRSFLYHSREILKREGSTPFIEGCLQKAEAFRAFEASLQIKDDCIACSSSVLREHPKSVIDTCIDFANRKYANDPEILKKIKIAADYIFEEIFLAFNIVDLLKNPRYIIRHRHWFGYRSRLQKSMEIIAYLFPNQPAYAQEKVNALLPRIDALLALHNILFPNMNMEDYSDVNDYAERGLKDETYILLASKAVIQASAQACEDVLQYVFYCNSKNPIDVLVNELRAVRNLCKAIEQEDLKSALAAAIMIDKARLIVFCEAVVTYCSQSERAVSAIRLIKQFHEAFYCDDKVKIMSVLFTLPPGLLSEALELLSTDKNRWAKTQQERAIKALAFVKTGEALQLALETEAREETISLAFDLISQDSTCLPGVLEVLHQELRKKNIDCSAAAKYVEMFLFFIISKSSDSQFLDYVSESTEGNSGYAVFRRLAKTRNFSNLTWETVLRLSETIQSKVSIRHNRDWYLRLGRMIGVLKGLLQLKAVVGAQNEEKIIAIGVEIAVQNYHRELSYPAGDMLSLALKSYPENHINKNRCLAAIQNQSGQVHDLFEAIGYVSHVSSLSLHNMTRASQYLEKVVRNSPNHDVADCVRMVKYALQYLPCSALPKLQLLELLRDLLFSPRAFDLPRDVDLEQESAKIAEVFGHQLWLANSYEVLRAQLQKDEYGVAAPMYLKHLHDAKTKDPKAAKVLDRFDMLIRFTLNKSHLSKGLVPFVVPDLAPNVPLEELVERFDAANFTNNELKVRLSSDFTEEDARTHLLDAIVEQKSDEIRRKRITDRLPAFSDEALYLEFTRQYPEEALERLVNEAIGAFFPRRYIREALVKFVGNVQAKAQIALLPRGQAGEKWYKEIHSMLTHIIHKLRDANADTVKDCLVDILRAADHCAVGIEEAVVRRYRQVVLNQAPTPVEEMYEGLARYRNILCESLMVPQGRPESVMFYAKLGASLGEEFGLPNYQRFRDTEAVRFGAYGKVEAPRDRVRFFGLYNVGAIVEYMAPDISGVKAKKDFCLSCVPKGWKRPAGIEYEELRALVKQWIATLPAEKIVKDLQDDKYGLWIRKEDLSQIDAAIDGLCKSEYMASISNADGSITYQGIANMLCEIGVFRHT